ncbi:hypothetical protein NE237_019863 [Protea cynaroides]|uniref:YDG domain-containing protein n=1 Tax=Protea cynaroides TaxID=273540 RepID=A0A9Q0H5J5_9MAGN|nr:hypothetical protein NE237_019863 [Protea cynaroides]
MLIPIFVLDLIFLVIYNVGRYLSGNKRTTKLQSFDLEFKCTNEAFRVSCKNGYPVRVVRSKEICSSYAPETGLRYDGIYRIENVGVKLEFKVTRSADICLFAVTMNLLHHGQVMSMETVQDLFRSLRMQQTAEK